MTSVNLMGEVTRQDVVAAGDQQSRPPAISPSTSLPAFLRRARRGRLEGLQRPLGVREPSELAVGLREQILRPGELAFRAIACSNQRTLRSLRPGLNQRLSREKEVARLVGIALCRFDRHVEGALIVPKLDHQIREVRIDHVVAGVVLVDERERLEVVLLGLCDIAERLRRQAEVVPRSVGGRVERRRAPQRVGGLCVPALLVVDAPEIAWNLRVVWRTRRRAFQRFFGFGVAAKKYAPWPSPSKAAMYSGSSVRDAIERWRPRRRAAAQAAAPARAQERVGALGPHSLAAQ